MILSLFCSLFPSQKFLTELQARCTIYLLLLNIEDQTEKWAVAEEELSFEQQLEGLLLLPNLAINNKQTNLLKNCKHGSEVLM